MTTIAFRAGVLAADSLVTVNTHRDGSCVKIAKNGPYLACASGSWPIALAFLDWFRMGLPPEKTPRMEADKDTGAVGHIFLPDNETIVTFSVLGWTQKKAPYYAVGTGSDYCYGALAMGASAEEAVRAALIFETASGGDIVILRREQALTPKQAAVRLIG